VRLRNENLVPPVLAASKDFLLRRSHRQFASCSGGVLLTPHIHTREMMAVALRRWHTNRDVSLGSAASDLTPQRNAVHSVSMRRYSSLTLYRSNTSPSYNPQTRSRVSPSAASPFAGKSYNPCQTYSYTHPLPISPLGERRKVPVCSSYKRLGSWYQIILEAYEACLTFFLSSTFLARTSKMAEKC
jgi:hypothetical protein